MTDPILQQLLRDAEEEQRLSELLGVELSAPYSRFEPPVYLPLESWLRRSEEVHRFQRSSIRRERAATKR
jgi:hypothetical protein